MPGNKHSFEEKLLVVQHYLSGESASSLESIYRIDHHDVIMYVNHKTVSKLMRQMHLKALRTPRQFHTYKVNVGKVAPNTVNRNFRAKEPNKKWTTDVTQVLIKDERIYLFPILDMFNGEIITYTITSRPDLKMVIDMVQKAMKKVPEHNGLILHSDQGWHYQHVKYQNELRINGIEQSMSRKGNCLDNAMMENFFWDNEDGIAIFASVE